MNPQTDSTQDGLRRAAPRSSLDELGDLFFSAPAGATGSRAATGLDDLLCGRAAAGGPAERGDAPTVEVTAVLAGGLPHDRRAALGRAALARVAAPAADAPPPPVVLLSGSRADVHTALGDPVDPASLQAAARAAGRLVLVIADRVAGWLDAGRRLPEHCVVLVTPEAESLLEAYRELKTATAATTGPVPEVLVMEAGTEAAAERTYRRLARVAIAHLNCTPTFAGHRIDRIGDAAGADDTDEKPTENAEQVYRLLSPLLAAPGDGSPAPARRDAPPAQPTSVEVTPCPPSAGGRATSPPVAGVVHPPDATTHRCAFTSWEPASTDELLGAVRASIDGLLPGARGFVPLDGLVDAPEPPDVVAVDDAGRAVAVLVADDTDPSALRRAVDAHAWLAAYAGLLARAFPEAGLDTTDPGPRSIVLVPDGSAGALESLCPPHVGLAAYTPVACGDARGLLFRQVLRPVETSPRAGTKRPAAAQGSISGATPPDSAGPDDSATAEPALDEAEPAGTSPDDDLSADEINDLKGAFEIDELT